jgi:purine-binding chemotaxis protein CheW
MITDNARTSATTSVVSTSAEDQFLTFEIDGARYAVDILSVQEILGYSSVTRVPRAPVYVRGVMNLRGTIVPIVDLRLKLGLATLEPDRTTAIVVTQVSGKVVGWIVDAVSGVVSFPAETIQPVPSLESGPRARWSKGVARTSETLHVILDLVAMVGEDGPTEILAGAAQTADVAKHE